MKPTQQPQPVHIIPPPVPCGACLGSRVRENDDGRPVNCPVCHGTGYEPADGSGR